ncbi:MAG: single-stranded DNA-binding protein [Treponema sp.]|jgi:single-strand DNA-binding protein|nr:single-stranded DNA-binding protein [Treponema sp.]
MNDLNHYLVEGNLVRDPSMRFTPKGTPICSFSVASNRYFKSDDGIEKEVSFFDVEAWGSLAETCNALGEKGRGVRLTGRLKQERWDKDGDRRSKVVIVAEHVEWKPEKKGETRTDAGTGNNNQEDHNG